MLFFDRIHFLQEALKGAPACWPGSSFNRRKNPLDRLWLGRVGFDISVDTDDLGELDDAGEVQIRKLLPYELQNPVAIHFPIGLQVGDESGG